MSTIELFRDFHLTDQGTAEADRYSTNLFFDLECPMQKLFDSVVACLVFLVPSEIPQFAFQSFI